MNLSEAEIGQLVTIDTIDCEETQSQIIRLGIGVGDLVTPISRVPGGPTIVKKGHMEIAFGRSLAEMIKVNTSV